MKTKLTLLFFYGFTIFCLYAYFSETYAQEKNAPKSLIKIVKTPSFGLPLECTLNDDCWVMNYVDIGPDDNKNTDIACLARTYDGHKGTDIAIPDEVAMKTGVNVLAAMDGTIKKIRDGEEDRWPTPDDLKQTKEDRKECGNAILIDHANGLQSLYCHLKKNSIRVKADQRIKKGEKIAQVGLSGFTQFPHLHFGVIWEGAIIDPFTGQNNTGICGVQKKHLWDKNLDINYQPLSIHNIGFSKTIPDLKNIERDTSSIPFISSNDDLLAFWVTYFGARAGDNITMEIKDFNGKIFAKRTIEQPKIRARQFYYVGRKLQDINITESAYSYSGKVTISRTLPNGEERQWTKSTSILITP